jgi:Transmembrane secretion effector
MIITRLPAYRLSIDFTQDLNLEPAPVSIFSNNPAQLSGPLEGPLSILTKFQVDADGRDNFFDLMGKARLIYLRNGAFGWHLKSDLAQPNHFEMEVVVPSWTQHLRQRERMTKDEMETIHKLYSLHCGSNAPEESTSLYLDKEVLARKPQSEN